MKKLFIISALLGAMFFTSCEDFLDVNYTKDSPITTSVDQVLPVATFYAAQICYDHAEYGVYMCQALTTLGKSQTGSYPYSQGWEFLGVNRHPMWRRHFYDLGANIQKMNEIAMANGQYNAVLIGRTIMLMSTMLTTDAFGDMPRTEVYKSASPKYDTQEEIYEWMFQEAEELLKLYDDPAWVNATSNLLINERMDRIYAGDMSKWKTFCQALQARLWLRKLPNWDNTPATCQKIIQMIDNVFASNWQEPRYYYPGGVTESNCPWGPYAPKINSWESRDNRLDESLPTTFFMKSILGGYEFQDGQFQTPRGYALDPRASRMMQQRTEEKENPMRHLESNIGGDIDKTIVNYPNLLAPNNPFTQNDGYIALITEEELLFIKAEAQYWAKDIKGAYESTKAAMEMNMKRYGIDVTAIQVDPAYLTLKNQYDLFLAVKLPGDAQFTIADLMQQKFVAMYLQPEQWIDMRRYNYSSSTNGIYYPHPVSAQRVFVYDVNGVHNGTLWNNVKYLQLKKDTTKENPLMEMELNNFTITYALKRPYNLYEAYWYTAENYGNNAELSPNAWVMRLNADTETETKYNKKELDRMGYYTTNAAGEKILDYRILKKRLIWAKQHNGPVQSTDPGIVWM
ncbi:MAG: SusD/RagB family nutrient-binding outer membrane lipoprotein [Paludibacteraceae bacterium]|nr:SusD/RagB family nutrient-binding outer membrane lipoprotein [Paludibacteraceae bacterium]